MECSKWFQFQNGSIKSLGSFVVATRDAAFQFQNGSIKSLSESKMGDYFERFNSKMVRLKVDVYISLPA